MSTEQTAQASRSSRRSPRGPGSTAGPGGRGELAFKVGRTRDRPPPRRPRRALRLPRAGLGGARGARAGSAPTRSSPTSAGPRRARIESDADVRDVIALLRLNYDRVVEHGSRLAGAARVSGRTASAEAIVTGASRGLGLALARGLAERGWRLVVDARGADALERAAAPPARRDRASPATSPTTAHRRALVAAAGEPASTCSSTTRARSGRARSPRSPTTRSTSSQRVYEVNVLAPLALAQLALPRLRPGAAIVNVTSDAARRGVRGLGRLRVVEGRARAADGGPRRRAPASSRVYTFDPGDMRTAMHQEAFPGEDISDRPPPERERARPARADRGPARRAAATAPPSSCGGDAMSALAARPRASRRTSRPRRAATAATTSRCSSPTAADGALAPRRASASSAAFLEPGDLLVVNTSATLPAGSPRAGSASGRCELRLSTPVAAGALGRRAARTTTVAASRAAGRKPSRPARRAQRRVLAPFAGSERLAVARLDLAVPLRALPPASRPADPLRLCPGRMAARRVPDRVRPRAGQRGDAERRTAVHAGARRRARLARHPDRARHAAHGRLLAGGRRAPIPRALPTCPSRRRAS